MTRSHTQIITFASVIIVLLIAYALRTNGLYTYPPAISNDEAINAVDAFYFATTGTLPLYEEFEGREPLFRMIQGMGMLLFGKTVWATRIISVLFSLPFIASTMWVTREALYNYPRHVKIIASITAGIVIATMMGHIVISRSIYRAPLFYLSMSLSIGFILRGLRRNRWIDFISSGIWGGITLYSYTAAWFFPFSFFILALALFVTRFKDWRSWLPKLMITGVTAGVVCLPIIYLLLTNPESVFVRANAVTTSDTIDWMGRLNAMYSAFFINGDPNPQYNAHIAPLIPQMFRWIFYAGFVALLVRIRKAESWFLFTIFILMIFPSLLSNEVKHGLRLSGQFVIVPVIIGLGAGLITWVLNRVIKHPVIVTMIALLPLSYVAIVFTADTWSRYLTFYDEPEQWRLWTIYDRQLNHNEWFFRTDRRAFGEWIAGQDFPMLVPVAELDRQSTRSWLMQAYPDVTSADVDIIMPEDVQLVVPWALETNSLMRETRQYALLNNGEIIILPLLSEVSHDALLATIENSTAIENDGQLDFLGYHQVINSEIIEFEVPLASGDVIATFGDGDMALTGWSGDNTINDDTLNFALEWNAYQQIGHSYITSIQLQTQDYERIVGQDNYLMRWAYPTLAWDKNIPVWSSHQLNIPSDLDAGAYRLTLGVFYPIAPLVSAESGVGEVINDRVTVGWLKVPQDEIEIPDTANPVELSIDDLFDLTHIEFATGGDGQLLGQLHWESLINRPQVDATIFIHIVDANGDIVAQSDSRPLGGQYPTFIWDAGEVVRTDHIFNFDDIENLDDYTVRVGMYTFPGPVNLSARTSDRQYDDGLVILGSLADFVTASEE